MTTVGIRELKAHLSEYIRLASQGETVVVTHRGKDVVVMQAPSAEHDGLRRLMESGMVKWSGGKPKGLTGPPIKIKGEPLSKTVLDMRDQDA
jgi:prevent-host-death family protein